MRNWHAAMVFFFGYRMLVANPSWRMEGLPSPFDGFATCFLCLVWCQRGVITPVKISEATG